MKVNKDLVFLTFISLFVMGFISTYILGKVDLFTYSTWGLCINTYKHGHLSTSPYGNVTSDYWAYHPNMYSDLFSPSLLCSVYLSVTSIEPLYLTFVIVLLYVLSLVVLWRNVFDQTNKSPGDSLLRDAFIIVILLRSAQFPSFSFYYISYGLALYLTYIMLIITTLSRRFSRIKTTTIIVLLVFATNYAYYTAVFLMLTTTTSIFLLFKILDYWKPRGIRIEENGYADRLSIIFVSTLISMALLVLFNPIVSSTLSPVSEIPPLSQVVLRTLREYVHTPSYETFQINNTTSQLEKMSHILIFLNRISMVTMTCIYVYVIGSRILKSRRMAKPDLMVVMLTISLFSSGVLINIVYKIWNYPGVHTYVLNLGLTLSIFSGVMLYERYLVPVLKKRIIKAIPYVLTGITVVYVIWSYAVFAFLIYDPVNPSNYHDQAKHVIRFVVDNIQPPGILVSDTRFCSQLYYTLENKNRVTEFMYRPFITDPLSVNENCLSRTSCYYVIAKAWRTHPFRGGEAWRFIDPLNDRLDVMAMSKSTIYQDARFILLSMN